jgi:hypothetical protein
MNYQTIFLVGILVSCVAVYIVTQSTMAVGVILALVAIGLYVAELFDYKVLPFNVGLEVVPVGADQLFGKISGSIPSSLSEVFFVKGEYTYEEAPAVCAVYNAELASYDQVAEAFAKGAEWCGYGWSVGGMALYPTQEDSWKKYQQEIDTKKRVRCGRPGINGVYFDPKTKFGVNCFGAKPNCNNRKYPIPIETGDVNPELLKKLKEDSGKIKVDPFNRYGWSMWGMLG